MVGEDKREDITCLYKHPEGSLDEREAFQNALKFGHISELKKAILSKDDEPSGFEIGR